MRRIAMWIVAFGLAAMPAMAASGTDKGNDGAKPSASSANTSTTTSGTDTAKNTNQPAAATQPAAANVQPGTLANSSDDKKSAVEEELDELRTLIKAQNDQLEEQHKEIEDMKARMANEASGSSSVPAAASSATTSAPAPAAAAAPSSTAAPSAAPAAGTAPASAVIPAPSVNSAALPPTPQDETSPLQFKIGDAYITPVGFMDFTMVYRDHNEGNGIGTNFAGIQLGNGIYQNALSEFRASMQNSRIGFRVDAMVKGAHVIGYMESDFLGNNAANVAVTSNSNTLRSRLYWVDVSKNKWEILAGQTWSLATPNRVGVSPLPADVFYSQDMDVNYQVGLVWGRIPELRFVYHPSNKVALAVALDSPEQYDGGANGAPSATYPSTFTGLAGTQVDNGTTTLNAPNVAPDVIVKLAIDPSKRYHFEVGGIERQFKIDNTGTATTFGATGAGGFANMNVTLFKGLRFIGNSFWSSGGGRYIFGSGPDFAIAPTGAISPLHAGSGIAGFEWTAGKSLFYGYFGADYFSRDTILDTTQTPNKFVGYGFPGSATSQNRTIEESTIGWIQTMWKDPKYGALSLITQYSYLSRNPWVTAAAGPEDAHVNMFWIDLRYTLPGSAPTMGH
jgi:TolA-binding protein